MYDLSGHQIGKYRVEGLIAHGGMAAVYRGRDTALDRDVAIKVLNPGLAHDPRAVERFQREAITAANLEHPNIVRVYDVNTTDGLAYIAMRYVPGETLRERLQREGCLPLDQIVPILRGGAAALTYAHRRGVIHRDVKPGNILLEPGGAVLLTDFGIARSMGEAHLTGTGQVLGTAQYLAPEQIQGAEAGPPSDVYALGVVLYEMLTGHLPFDGDDLAAVLYRQVHDPPPSPRTGAPAMDAALAPILARALNKEPALRYPTPDALALDLAQAVARLPGGAMTAPARHDPPPAVAAQRITTPHPAPVPVAGSAADSVPLRAPVRRAARRPVGRPVLLLGGVILLLLGAGVLLVAALRGGGGGEPRFDPPAAVTYKGPLRQDNGPDIHLTRARRPPTVDGDLADWAGATTFTAPSVILNQGYAGPADLSAAFHAAYDATNFYLAVVVTDDVHVQNAQTRGDNLWQGDNIELWFDLKLADDFTRATVDADDWELGLSPGDFGGLGPEAVVFLPRAQPAPQIRVAARPRAGNAGYTLEAAIPWALLGFTPAPGAAIGFAAGVSDNDHPGTAWQEHLLSSAPRLKWNQPTTFGNLFF